MASPGRSPAKSRPNAERSLSPLRVAWTTLQSAPDTPDARAVQEALYREVHSGPSATPEARAEAARLWADLYREVHSPLAETWTDRIARIADRIAAIDAEAAKVGLSPILFYLREFALDLAHAALISHGQVKTFDRSLNGPPREGNPGRSLDEQIDISVEIQKKRWLEGVTLDDACEEVSIARRGPRMEGTRRIHENLKKEKNAEAIVRAIAISQILDATANDPIARDRACKAMARDMQRRAKDHPKN